MWSSPVVLICQEEILFDILFGAVCGVFMCKCVVRVSVVDFGSRSFVMISIFYHYCYFHFVQIPNLLEGDKKLESGKP